MQYMSENLKEKHYQTDCCRNKHLYDLHTECILSSPEVKLLEGDKPLSIVQPWF